MKKNQQKPKMKVVGQNQETSSKSTSKEKKTVVKYASVKTYQVTRGKRSSKVSRFKRWLIETVWKLKIQDTYYYEVILSYYNGRIHPKDVVVSEDGTIFYVLNESNRIAKLITYNAVVDKPVLKGKIQIHRDSNKKQQ